MDPQQQVTPSADDQNRSHRVTIRFTKPEIERLQRAVNTTVSREMADYIRRAILGRKIQVIYRDRSMDELIRELVILRKELNAIGNNFNQITKKVNATAGQKEFPFWVEHAASMQETLLQKIKVIEATTEKFALQWFAKSSTGATSGEP